MPVSEPEAASENTAEAGPVIAEASAKASAEPPAILPAAPPPAPGASPSRASATGSGQVKDSPKNPPKEASTTKGSLKDSGNSLRVSADKLDTLVDLVGELVIVQAQISQIVSERSDPILTSLAEQLERLSADLRDSTLGIRMFESVALMQHGQWIAAAGNIGGQTVLGVGAIVGGLALGRLF